MSKPTELPEWATETNYDAPGQSWDGTATKVDPGGTLKAEGWQPAFQPPAQYHNWWMGKVGEWLAWLDGHLGEQAGKLSLLTGFVVPGTADDVEINTELNANGGAVVSDLHVTGGTLFDGTVKIDAPHEYAYDEDRARTKHISPHKGSFLTDNWVYGASSDFLRQPVVSGTSEARAVVPIELPHGALLKEVRVTLDAGSGTRVLTIRKQNHTTGAPTSLGGFSGSTNALAVSDIDETIDNAAFAYYADIGIPSSSGGTRLRAVVVDFDDPGPRNH
jgi:hypothetical protein